MSWRRRRFLAAAIGAGTVAAAGCLDALTGDDAPEPDSEPVVGGGETGDGDPFFSHDVDPAYGYETFADRAISGGVSKDGIPSIDDPSFASAADGDARLDRGDPVFGVEIDGQARAYPQYILVRHEIVNDELAGYEVAVTYCPLTGTVLGFDRAGDEFGVSGMLVNSNLVMYDRVSESWWPQVLGSLVRGDEDAGTLGRSLREFRIVWTTWGRWRDVHPDTEVLAEDTDAPFGYARDPYGAYNPASGYYTDGDAMFSLIHEDDRHHPKEVFIGARTGDGKVAFRKDRLREDHLLEAEVGDTPYLAAYHHALDSAWVYRNPDGERFTTAGEGYEGPDGERYTADVLPLEEVNAFDAMWFAWIAFYPESVVVA